MTEKTVLDSEIAQGATLPIGRRSPAEAEANEAAREMSAARDRYRRWHALTYETSLADSALIDEQWQRENRERILGGAEDKPVDQVQWWDVDHLDNAEPGRGEALWRRVRQEAREELESGWRAARIMEPRTGSDGPWERARFLALRDALREEWRPRPGVESSLVDMLAQIHATYEEWLKRHVHRMAFTGIAVTREEKEYRDGRGQYVTLRVSEHEELEQTAAMADRWQKA